MTKKKLKVTSRPPTKAEADRLEKASRKSDQALYAELSRQGRTLEDYLDQFAP